MNFIRKFGPGFLVILLTILPWTTDVKAGEIGGDAWEEIGVEGDSTSSTFTPGSKVQFQAGVMYRFAGERLNEGGESYLFTLDLNGLFHWDRRSSTWGAGLHLGFDGDGGTRLGPKVLWRTSLQDDKPHFLQLGLCVYLTSSADPIYATNSQGESMRGAVQTPGLSFEAELGINDQVSLILALEALSVEYETYDVPSHSYDGSGKTTDTHYYIGGKFGGWPGAILVVVGTVTAGVVVASSMSGW